MLIPQFFTNVLKIRTDRAQRISLLIIVVITLVTFSTSAQQRPKAILVDEFGEVCSEFLMSRIDNLMAQLSNNPSAIAIVIFHGRKDTEGRNQFLLRYISVLYPMMRGFDRSRMRFLEAETRDNQQIQFWLVPPGAEQPGFSPYKSPTYTEPTLFDRAWIGFNRREGQLDIYRDGFLNLGCSFSPNRGRFAKALQDTSDLDAFLLVYTTRENRSHGVKLASFALNDLVVNYRVPRKRVRSIYGGIRKKPEIELWLVPRGQKPPRLDLSKPPIQDF